MALRNQPMGRSFDENTSGKINPAPRVPKPRILTKAEWGGGEGTTTLMRSHFPTSITLHHTGDAKPLTHDVDPAKLLRAIQQWGWRDKHWPDLPYHYLIDLDGNIYQGRDPLKVGDTSTTYDPTGHLLVSVIGNYMLQAPNEKQLESIIDLFAYLCDLYNINPETLRGHQELYESTDCPGKYLYAYVPSGYIEGEIRKRLQRAYGVKPDGTETTKTVTAK